MLRVCASQVDLDQGKPHLRTYDGRQAEKFYETFLQPHLPPKPGKAYATPPGEPSHTWGMGGSMAQGKRYIPVPAADDIKISQKKYLVPAESEVISMAEDLGRKGRIYDAHGVNMKQRRSEGFLLEDVLQRKGRVPEEMRVDHRDIHRVAPPGLKGYMGAEYSNDFFTKGRDLGIVGPKAVPRPTKKTFKEKRAEEEVADQVALVARLGGGEDSDDDEGAAAAAPAAEE